MFTRMFVLVKTQSWGHAFVAFGNDNPQIVFNQSGADGSNSAWGDSARFSRVSWADARDNFIVGRDKYFGYWVRNGFVMRAYNYANNLFENSPLRGNEDPARHRNRAYNAVTQNCATLTRDICLECGLWLTRGVITPLAIFNTLGQSDIIYRNVAQWGIVDRHGGTLRWSGPWGLAG